MKTKNTKKSKPQKKKVRYKNIVRVAILPEHKLCLDDEVGHGQASMLIRTIMRAFLEGHYDDAEILKNFEEMSKAPRVSLLNTSFTLIPEDVAELKEVTGKFHFSTMIRAILEYFFNDALQRKRKTIKGKNRVRSKFDTVREALRQTPSRINSRGLPAPYVPGIAAPPHTGDVHNS